MDVISRTDTGYVLVQFSDAVAALEAALQYSDEVGARTETDEECDTPSRIFESFYKEGGSVALTQL